MAQEEKKRCGWVPLDKPYYVRYHDEEWGVPVRDDRHLFEMLVLEGAQAGLSWDTVLRRRENYRKAFHNFDVQRVAQMSDAELEGLLDDSGIIRNRLKVYSARRNARVFMDIQAEYGSFSGYLRKFTGEKPQVNRPSSLAEIPVTTPQSDALSKDLKRRGMNFVGSTIIYAYMQAVGLVDDHVAGCFRCR